MKNNRRVKDVFFQVACLLVSYVTLGFLGFARAAESPAHLGGSGRAAVGTAVLRCAHLHR